MYERLKPKIQNIIQSVTQNAISRVIPGVNPGVNPLGFHSSGFHRLLGLVMLGLVVCLPKFADATPTTNLLIADESNHRMIEVDPITHNVIWQYGQTGVAGSRTNQLNLPHEATKLKNGNVLIVDSFNQRVIEVQPTGTSGGTIVYQYGQTGISGIGPNQLGVSMDVQKLSNGNILIVDGSYHRVLEIQPTPPAGGSIVWEYSTGPGLPFEAERLLDGSTLIAIYGGAGKVIRVTGNPPTTIWSYDVDGNKDATQLINGNILIVNSDNHYVREVQPIGTSGGTIVWQYGQEGIPGSGTNRLRDPQEAIRLANGNTMIVDGYNHRVIEVKTSDYPNFTADSIVWQQGITGMWGGIWNLLYHPVDVEEIWQGILNQVLVEYKDMANMPQPVVTAWVFTPLLPPVVEPPVLEVTKTVSPAGTQTPGTVLTYTIAYTNTGQGTATDAVFMDMVPPGTVYGTGTAVIVTGPAGNITYSHDSGATYNTSDSAPVTHIRWSIPAIGPGKNGTLRFSVRIQ